MLRSDEEGYDPMTPSVPLSQAHDLCAQIAALRAEVKRLVDLAYRLIPNQDGMGQTWKTHATATEADVRALVEALDHCESNRGVYSCAEPHDLRCPKSRAATAAEWKGVWQCECGREDLDAALARPGVVRVREEAER